MIHVVADGHLNTLQVEINNFDGKQSEHFIHLNTFSTTMAPNNLAFVFLLGTHFIIVKGEKGIERASKY